MDMNLVLAQHQYMETERLQLRPIVLEDAADMFEYSSDEKNMLFVFTPHQTMEDTRANIANYFIASPLGKYGIELKESKKIIGSIDLRVNENKRSAELGYALNPKYWGNGYVTEAAEALVKLSFEKLELIRVYSFHDEDNPASGRVMEKLGMKIEGKIKNSRISKGKIVTDIVRGITIEEWKLKEKLF